MIEYRRRQRICGGCSRCFYPLDHQLEISRSSASKRFAKVCSLLAIFLPYSHAGKLLHQTLGVQVSQTLMSQIIYRVGTKLGRNRAEEALPKPDAPEVLYMLADGAMVPMAGQGKFEYKENKLAVVFTDADIRESGGAENPRITIENKRFVTSLAEGTERFTRDVVGVARQSGSEKAGTIVFLSDGARWLRKLRMTHFPHAVAILDWYHAVEHLWTTARTLFGENQHERCARWVEPLERMLWEGKVSEVLSWLRAEIQKKPGDQTPLVELHTYFSSNEKIMDYPRYRQAGYYIGSGVVESANKYIVAARMKLSGMRWTGDQANALLWLRCRYFEGRWDEFWDEIDLEEYLADPSAPGSEENAA
jgi:hypothetical protein